jgi:hypothetical protein
VLSGTNQIFIGASNKSTNISGTTNILGTLNVSSGTINASYFTMFSSVIDSKPTTWLDTIQSNLNTQIAVGFYNASEVFIGGPNTKNINVGGSLSGTASINIGGSANTTTGYCIFGSTGMDASYIRARNIYMNSDGVGNTNIGNTYGVFNLTSIYGLITSAAGNSPNPASFLTISCKNGQRADALTIQSKYDYNWLIVFYNENGVVRGKVAGINSTSVEYATSSDRRLKKNIQPMDSMMENIMRMKPSTFGWITNDDIGYGFIAQEVYEIFPHLRHKHPSCKESCDVNPCDCSGNPVYYGLDYGQFTPYIVKAMQEMKICYDAKLQEQSDQITQLMARVAALESS